MAIGFVASAAIFCLQQAKRAYFVVSMDMFALPTASADTALQANQFADAWQAGAATFELTTSGSTGAPKALVVERSRMEASALATTHFLGLERNKPALICLHTGYIGGKMALVRGLQLGWQLYVTDPAARALAHWPTHLPPPYHASMVPLQLEATLAEIELRQRLEGMHSVLVGGAPLSIQLEEKAAAVQGVRLYQTFGMTETVSHIALRPINGEARSEVYQLLPNHLARVDDRKCLAVCGPVTRDVWVQSNDVVQLVSPTQFIWMGRADFTINTGGIKLQPEQLEITLAPLLQAFGYAGSFYITPRPDERLGQKVVLVLDRKGVDANKLLRYLASQLPPYHAPKAVEYQSNFARTATGKIIRT
jgi:O-succinylbenzoic acid--CoA ligase